MKSSQAAWAGEMPPDVAPAALALKRFVSTMMRGALELFAGRGLTMQQLQVLHAVRHHGRVSGRQLARELRVSPAAVVQLCDRLQEQRFLCRVRSTDDRRVTWLQLQPDATELFEQLAVRHAHVREALRALSPADRDHLARLLATLTKALEEARSAEP